MLQLFLVVNVGCGAAGSWYITVIREYKKIRTGHKEQKNFFITFTAQ